MRAHFKYKEDVRTERNAQCSGVSTVECFARIRVGYCDYYASTMTVLLRASGVPARVAYGFLPGDRGTDGVEIVGAWLAHYWVEVYFPGVGWIEFDPTGGGIGRPQAIPSGSPARQTAKPTAGPGATFPNSTSPPSTTAPGGGGSTTPGAGIGPFIAIAIILDDRHRRPRHRRHPAEPEQADASRPGVGLAGRGSRLDSASDRRSPRPSTSTPARWATPCRGPVWS